MVKEYATSLGAILKLVSAKEGKNIEVKLCLFRTCLILWGRWLSRREDCQLRLEEQRWRIRRRRKSRDAADKPIYFKLIWWKDSTGIEDKASSYKLEYMMF